MDSMVRERKETGDNGREEKGNEGRRARGLMRERMGRDEKRKRQDKEGKGEDGEGKQQAATPTDRFKLCLPSQK